MLLSTSRHLGAAGRRPPLLPTASGRASPTIRSKLAQARPAAAVRAIASNARPILEQLELLPARPDEPLPGVYDGQWKQGQGGVLEPVDPATGLPIGLQVSAANGPQTLATIAHSRAAFTTWRNVPGPRRGEILKDVNRELVRLKEPLAGLITLEMGKIKSESLGEVEEVVQICDYALGLSRIFGGKIIASERPGHIIKEIPNPLGLVGVITAFNFPCAVYGWNFALSFITGNATIWKPSPTTPLTAIAMNKIITRVLESHGLPGALSSLVCGGASVGGKLATEKTVDLVSFTGSEHVGRQVGETVQSRFGKALVVMPSASVDLALRATVFGAIGTAGQRCTTTRRLFLHEKIAETFVSSLKRSYEQMTARTGHGLEPSTLLCALHTPQAVASYLECIGECKAAGGKVVHGGQRIKQTQFVEPTIVYWGERLKDPSTMPEIVRKEVFGPILHVGTFRELQEAVEMTNAVDQALSSSLFST